MIGTDYSHTDISANLSALDEVRELGGRGHGSATPRRTRFSRPTPGVLRAVN